MRKGYQNAQEIVKYWLRKIKYTKLKILTLYFRLIKALLAKKKIYLRRKTQNLMFSD
jgi:hypothetical protein